MFTCFEMVLVCLFKTVGFFFSPLQSLRCGTTGVVTFIRGNMLHVAWLGDSQVMLVRRGQAVELMKPHKPDREVRMACFKLTHPPTRAYHWSWQVLASYGILGHWVLLCQCLSEWQSMAQLLWFGWKVAWKSANPLSSSGGVFRVWWRALRALFKQLLCCLAV